MNIKNGLYRLNLVFWGLMIVLFSAGQVFLILTYHEAVAIWPLVLVVISAMILWGLCRSIISAFFE